MNGDARVDISIFYAMGATIATPSRCGCYSPRTQ